jgi:hypothetical protein
VPRPRELGQPTWPQILQGVIEKGARHIHKALPGRIVSYDVAAQTATVQPVIQSEGETMAPLFEVPVCFPGGAAGFLHIPLTAGDNVLVVFSDEDYSKWWVSGSISAPEIQQRHGLHAIAIPGLNPETTPFPATAGHVTLAATDELRLGDDGATDAVALAPLVEDQLADLVTRIGLWKVGINVLPPATPVTNGTLVGFIESLEEILAGWPGSVGASKVKAI